MTYKKSDIEKFIRESNSIENIHREPTVKEIFEFELLYSADSIEVVDLERFVRLCEPRARLRLKYPNDDVRVGAYSPPKSGVAVMEKLDQMLKCGLEAYDLHIAFELLHPFTDCNGRAGRLLWAWKHKDLSDGFLRPFYYQVLQKYSKQTAERQFRDELQFF